MDDFSQDAVPSRGDGAGQNNDRITRFTALPGGPEVTMCVTAADGVLVSCEGRRSFIVQPDQELKVARQIVTGCDPMRMSRAQLERLAAAYIAEVDGRNAYADKLDAMLAQPASNSLPMEKYNPDSWSSRCIDWGSR